MGIKIFEWLSLASFNRKNWYVVHFLFPRYILLFFIIYKVFFFLSSFQIAYESRIRSQKLRAEISNAKKEAEHYLSNVDLAQKMEKKGRLGKNVDGTEEMRRNYSQKKIFETK